MSTILKFSQKYQNLPKASWDKTDPDNWILTDSALFSVSLVGQRTVKHHPTELIGVVPTAKDSAVTTWWNGMSALEQAGCRIISRADADLLLDNYVQICSPPDPAMTHFQQAMDYLNTFV